MQTTREYTVSIIEIRFYSNSTRPAVQLYQVNNYELLTYKPPNETILSKDTEIRQLHGKGEEEQET